MLREAIERKLAATNGRKLRILEVGVGDGLLAGRIAPGLKGRNVEYVATDLGRTFVAKAEKAARAAGLDFLTFGVLDISRDPTTQGFAHGSFDFIIGLDVIHATPRLAETFGHLRTLLAPGGLFGVVEKVRTERWVDLVWGLAEGWWYFADSEIRPARPVACGGRLGAPAARMAFRRGRGLSAAIPTARAATDYALLLAQTTAARRPTEPPRAPEIARWFHVPVWRAAARRRAAAAPAGTRVAIVGENEGLAVRLAERWRRAGLTVMQAKATDDLAVNGRGGRLAGRLSGRRSNRDDNLRGERARIFELAQLARTLAGASGECALSLVSMQACAVSPGEVVHPTKALPAGALRVIPLECPGVACRQVDLARIDGEAIDWLADELLSPVREPMVAWREGKRWVQDVRLESFGKVAGGRLGRAARARGSISSRAGLARWASRLRASWRAARARIVLLGRAAPSAEKLARIKEIEALGGEVLTVTADVSDRAALAVAVNAARRPVRRHPRCDPHGGRLRTGRSLGAA